MIDTWTDIEKELSYKITEALNFAFQYGSFDGSHHKMWCIDQMVRILAGDHYDEWVKNYEMPLSEDEDDRYEWDVGTPP